jgi:GNAT superfamily N-acetyltransferase/DNA-binding HxlR family transcriptional regulator
MIEIGDYGRRSFPDLCAELKVPPAQLSHTLIELISRGIVKRELNSNNQGGQATAGHGETYTLTPAGVNALAEINAHAQDQVTKALAAAPPGAGAKITAAFQAYADALQRSRPSQADITPDITPTATPEPPQQPPFQPPTVSIVPGYRPGILARTLEMHLAFYYPREGWGRKFESVLSTVLAGLLDRLDRPGNQVWSAVMTTPGQQPGAPPLERVVGVVYIDGEAYPGEDGVAKVRAFIVDESTRGLGVGKQLFAAAMRFVRETGFRECRLTTQRCLTAARRLYEREGFKEAGEAWFEGFGNGIMELSYVWRREDEVA